MSSMNQFLQMLFPMLSNSSGNTNSVKSASNNNAPPWAVMTQQFDFSSPSPITFKSHIGYIPQQSDNTEQFQGNMDPYMPVPNTMHTQNNIVPYDQSSQYDYNPLYTMLMPSKQNQQGGITSSTSKNYADFMKQIMMMALLKEFMDKITGNKSNKKTKIETETDPKTEEPQIKAPVWSGKNGSVTGDPHFNALTDTNGDTDFDFHGSSGKAYNILSDKTLQYNAEFRHWSGTNTTVTSKTGIKLLSDDKSIHKVEFDCSKNLPVLDGKEMANGEKQTFKVSGEDATIEYNNGVLTVNTHEYKVEIHKRGEGSQIYLDQFVTTKENGVLADWVNPHGLLGQTADGDTNIRKGHKGDNAQGEGAIDYSYTDYEVADLFADSKEGINRFGIETVKTIEDGKVTRLKDKKGNLLATLDKDGNLVGIRHIKDGDGNNNLYLADGTTRIDETGKIIS